MVGFIIVGMFAVTWIIALAVWRLWHIEERWSSRLAEPKVAASA